MKVLYVINGLGTGGAERSLAEMLPSLEAKGIEPTVVCLFRRSKGVETSTAARYDVRFLTGRSVPVWAARVRRIVKEVRPALVHTVLFESDLAGRFGCVGTGVPVLTSLVNTSYDPVRLEDPNIRRWRLAATRQIDAWTARRLTTHFHAITQAVKDANVRDLGLDEERVTVVYRGRDTERLGEPGATRRDAVRSRLGIDPAQELVVTAGRQEFQKGHGFLLDAVAAIRARFPNLVVLVAGREGNMTADLLEQHRRLDLGDHLRFLGHRDDVADLMAAADVFVFPSLYEGLGGACIEAMALGLPIVASDVGALREVLAEGENALLVPPANPEILAQALERLLIDGQTRVAFGAASQRLFAERFSLSKSVEAMCTMYDRVVSSTAVRSTT